MPGRLKLHASLTQLSYLCHERHNDHLHEPFNRYVKLRVVHAPGMPGTFSPPPRVSDPDMHHGPCLTHVPWCKPVSLTSGFLWNRWRGKRFPHSRRMRNPQFYVSGKRPIFVVVCGCHTLAYRWLFMALVLVLRQSEQLNNICSIQIL